MSADSYLQARGHGSVLLAGIVGSTAYGLAREGSDRDRLGIFAADTVALCGLDRVAETLTWHDPSDVALHEAGKYARLALACNPTVLELLWLEEWEETSELGRQLIGIRDAFLSGPRVKDAYVGYARSQLARLRARGDGSFSAGGRDRAGKHARHMARLLEQGAHLYAHGHLSVRVKDPQWYLQFTDAGVDVWTQWFEEQARAFDQLTCALPDTADRESVADWLRAVRIAHLPD